MSQVTPSPSPNGFVSEPVAINPAGGGGNQQSSGPSADQIVLIGAGTLAGTGLIGYGIYRATRSQKSKSLAGGTASSGMPVANSISPALKTPDAAVTSEAGGPARSEKPFENSISPGVKACVEAESWEDCDRLFQKLNPEEKEKAVTELAETVGSAEGLRALNETCFTMMDGKMTQKMNQILWEKGLDYSLDPAELDIKKMLEQFISGSDEEKYLSIRSIYGFYENNIKKNDNVKFFLKNYYERIFKPHINGVTRQAIREEFKTVGIHV